MAKAYSEDHEAPLSDEKGACVWNADTTVTNREFKSIVV